MKGVHILEVAATPSSDRFGPSSWSAEVDQGRHVERGDAMRGLISSGVMASRWDVHVL